MLKMTIGEIKKLIIDNVENVTDIQKKTGENTWIIKLKDMHHVTTTFEELEALGFYIFPSTRTALHEDVLYEIECSFEHLPMTFYERQIRH